MIGGYQSSTDNMPQMLAALLQHAGFAEKVEGFCVSSGESAWPTSNQRFGAMNWVRGKGEVRFPVDAHTGTPFAQGPLRAVVLEVGSSYLTRFPTDRDAIRDFVAAAAERQLPAVLFLLPESISVTRKGRADRPQTYVPKTMAEFEKEYAAIDAVYQSVIQQFDVPVAPVHRVFLELHRLAPEMDLSPGHEDCYFSPREHYLAAYTIAMVLQAVPKTPISANDVMEPRRLQIEKHNEHVRKAKGKEMPWFPLSDAEQATIRTAVETAVESYEKDRTAYWSRIPKTVFALDATEIEVGAKAVLRWQVAGVDKVVIEPGLGEVPAQGERTVSPETTTTYSLTVPGLAVPHPTWSQELIVYKPLPAMAESAALKAGLQWEIRESAADLGGKVLLSGICQGISPAGVKNIPAMADPKATCDMVVKGLIRVEKTGVYRFQRLWTYDLRIDDTEVLNTKVGDLVPVGLVAGLHRFQARQAKVGVRNGQLTGGIRILWAPAGTWPCVREMPSEAKGLFFHEEKNNAP
jgi:hypothetical protein